MQTWETMQTAFDKILLDMMNDGVPTDTAAESIFRSILTNSTVIDHELVDINRVDVDIEEK